MNVWIVEIGEPLPEIDGNTRDWRCGMLSKALVARGHEVLWWAATFDHATKRHRFDGPRLIEIQPGLYIRLLHGPGYTRNSSPKRIRHHRMIARSFAREAASSSKPDVVFCCLPTLELAEQAVLYGQRTGLPVFIDIRDLWPDHYLTFFPEGLRGLASLLLFSEFRRLQRLLQGATGITAISNTFLNWALQRAGRQRQKTDGVFPMGYPALPSSLTPQVMAKQKELVARYGFKPDELIVTFAGTLVFSSFDLQTVIETARLLEQSKSDNIRFVIVGDGDDGPALRTQAEGLGNVIFTGWADQVSLRAMLNLSSVGLAPYRDDASMSLPNKPFEYMAAGLPLLSSLRGELETLIRTNRIGFQYQAGDTASMVEKLRWLAENQATWREMGQRAGQLFEERFSAARVYPHLIRHMERVVAKQTDLQGEWA